MLAAAVLACWRVSRSSTEEAPQRHRRWGVSGWWSGLIQPVLAGSRWEWPYVLVELDACGVVSARFLEQRTANASVPNSKHNSSNSSVVYLRGFSTHRNVCVAGASLRCGKTKCSGVSNALAHCCGEKAAGAGAGPTDSLPRALKSSALSTDMVGMATGSRRAVGLWCTWGGGEAGARAHGRRTLGAAATWRAVWERRIANAAERAFGRALSCWGAGVYGVGGGRVIAQWIFSMRDSSRPATWVSVRQESPCLSNNQHSTRDTGRKHNHRPLQHGQTWLDTHAGSLCIAPTPASDRHRPPNTLTTALRTTAQQTSPRPVPATHILTTAPYRPPTLSAVTRHGRPQPVRRAIPHRRLD